MRDASARVAIVDYGLGNLFSVQRACAHVGLQAGVTSSVDDVLRADGLILPGVGAMPTAMERLRTTGLGEAIIACAERGTPVFGICLGMQLLMKNGSEFGPHDGLGIIDGDVIRFAGTTAGGQALKVPHIGWNAIVPSPRGDASAWTGTLLEDVEPGSEMYFVHSFHVVARDPSVSIATTSYGSVSFCAAIARDNIFACQFHPERSGPVGLSMYARFGQHLMQPSAR